MRDAGGPDDDVPGAAFDGFVADLNQDMALEDDEGFVVRVVVQLRSLNDTDDGPCRPPSKVREISLPGRFAAFTWYTGCVTFP